MIGVAEERALERAREEGEARESAMAEAIAEAIAEVMQRFEPDHGGEVDTPLTRKAWRQLDCVVETLSGREAHPGDRVKFSDVQTGWRDADGTHVVLKDGSHFIRERSLDGRCYVWNEYEPVRGTFRAAVTGR